MGTGELGRGTEKSCGIPKEGGFDLLRLVGGRRAGANRTARQTWGLLPILENAVLCLRPTRTVKSSCVLEGMRKSLVFQTVHLDRGVKISLAMIIHWPCCYFQSLLLLLTISPVSLSFSCLLFSIFCFKAVFHPSVVAFLPHLGRKCNTIMPSLRLQHSVGLLCFEQKACFRFWEDTVVKLHLHFLTFSFLLFSFYSFFSFSPI